MSDLTGEPVVRIINASGEAHGEGTAIGHAVQWRYVSSFDFLSPGFAGFYSWLHPIYEQHPKSAITLLIAELVVGVGLPWVFPGKLDNVIGALLTVVAAFTNPITLTITKRD